MLFKIISLGCKVNSYECASLSSMLQKRGYFECGKKTPNVVIINTCSVTATADQKSRQHIRKMMNEYPNAICVVMGCYSQGNKEYIEREIGPHILVGTSNRNRIPDYIDMYLKNGTKIVEVDEKPRLFDYEEMGITSYTDNVRAYLKIEDGCDNFCSYCLIPLRRGKMRSRAKENVIAEAKYLINEGYKEIVLTGIHVGGYGQDLEGTSFSDLVSELANLDGLYSLRISSIEESEIDDKLIELVTTNSVLANHLHIPLQSGSDTVLIRMNRKYNSPQFISKLNLLRKRLPDIALTTDVIVGFPGETEEEFKETIETIKKCDFNMLHVFPFSAREGTKAYLMKDQVAPNIKKERVHRLLELSNELWNSYTNKYIGKELEVLVERFDKEKQLATGHTSNYIELEFETNSAKPGEIVKVLVQKSMIVSK